MQKPFLFKFVANYIAMKKLAQILMFSFVGLFAFNSCQSNAEPKTIAIEKKAKKTEVLAENREEVEMKVEGMVCAMGCAKFIEDKVADLDGIIASNVNFEEGVAKFEFDKTATDSKEIKKFINGIHDGQYKATLLEEVEKAEENETVDSDKESISSVAEHINISFPELFTYFLKRIR